MIDKKSKNYIALKNQIRDSLKDDFRRESCVSYDALEAPTILSDIVIHHIKQYEQGTLFRQVLKPEFLDHYDRVAVYWDKGKDKYIDYRRVEHTVLTEQLFDSAAEMIIHVIHQQEEEFLGMLRAAGEKQLLVAASPSHDVIYELIKNIEVYRVACASLITNHDIKREIFGGDDNYKYVKFNDAKFIRSNMFSDPIDEIIAVGESSVTGCEAIQRDWYCTMINGNLVFKKSSRFVIFNDNFVSMCKLEGGSDD